MKKSIVISFIAVLGVGLILFMFILQQHSYNMVEQEIEIDSPQGKLKGTLTLPTDYKGTLGLVVFVHGDGPIDASYDEGYKPLWEKLSSIGYASLSLSKPGIGGSEGNWLAQSMEDRAQEALLTINWAKSLPMIDEHRIGVWGASQAGWVIPKIARENQHLAFSIVVSPAINWLKQGAYNTRMEMTRDGYSAEDIVMREEKNAVVLNLLHTRASYAEYLNIADKHNLIPEERWGFIMQNHQSDATEELSYFNSPVHLVLGGQDINVDVNDTEAVYREQITPELLSVTFLPDVDHSMLNKTIASSKLKTYLTAVFFPKKLVDDNYYNDLIQFISQLDN